MDPTTLRITSDLPVLPSSSFVGDLDQDGWAEFVVATAGADGDTENGVAHVFYGRSTFPAQLDVSDAELTLTEFQGPVTALGDVNGDGHADFGFFGKGATGTPGRFDIFYGGAERPSGQVAASSLESSLGSGPPGSALAWISRFTAAGDVNGDGYDDMLAGGIYAGALILGRAEAFGQGSVVNASAATFVAAGGAPFSGAVPARAGDLDADGYEDLLISNDESFTALYYGRADTWSGQNEAVQPDAVFQGRSLRSMGDWDADGYADLGQFTTIVEFTDFTRAEVDTSTHQVGLVYGGSVRAQGSIEMYGPQTVPGSKEPILLTGPNDVFSGGTHELAVGDVNGDERLDLVLGAARDPAEPGSLAGTGAVFLLPGVVGPRAAELLVDADDAVLRGQRRDWMGLGVSANGDANGDGYQDILIVHGGSPDAFGPERALLVLGADNIR